MACEKYEVKRNDILLSKINRYLVLDFNGEGCFGKVAKCLNLETGETIAVKIHKDNEDFTIQKEVEMLETIKILDPEKNNIVRFVESFTFKGVSCQAFEMLDKSLWDLLVKNKERRMSLNNIRLVTQQLLVAFEALKSIRIMHTDLKPDNIMLVNHNDQPFKIKLIDFGLARPVSQVEIGMMMQPVSYRAPEVNLGLPLSEAVDMWGVGCVMAFLYFGINLFPDNCTYNWMRTMVHLLGMPSQDQLMYGRASWAYFDYDQFSNVRLRTPEEFEELTGFGTEVTSWYFDTASNLEDAIMRSQECQDRFERRDRIQFLNLLKGCLHLDPEQRITPSEALKHNFITMAHLVDNKGNEYVDAAFKCMTYSHPHNSDQSNDSLIDNEDHLIQEGTRDTTARTFDVPKEPSTAGSKNDLLPNIGHGAPREYYLQHCDKYSLTSFSWEEEIESASRDSFNQNSVSLNLSYISDMETSDSTGCPAATDLYDGVRDGSTPASKESGIAVTPSEDNANTDCLPIASDDRPADIIPADGATDGPIVSNNGDTEGHVPTSNGAAGIIITIDADDVNSAPEGVPRQNPFRRIRKFFGRMKKRVVSIFSHSQD